MIAFGLKPHRCLSIMVIFCLPTYSVGYAQTFKNVPIKKHNTSNGVEDDIIVMEYAVDKYKATR